MRFNPRSQEVGLFVELAIDYRLRLGEALALEEVADYRFVDLQTRLEVLDLR